MTNPLHLIESEVSTVTLHRQMSAALCVGPQTRARPDTDWRDLEPAQSCGSCAWAAWAPVRTVSSLHNYTNLMTISSRADGRLLQ